MSRTFRLPLAASIAGHCCIVALLILLIGRLPPVQLPVPVATGGIAIMLAPPVPPPPIAEAPPPPPEPPPVVEAEPPPPEPPPPVVEAEPPPPQPKPAAKPPPRRPPPQPAPPQIAVVPRSAAPPSLPPAGPISAAYRAALSSWLESHKRYPESARARGEEGRAVLRFRIDRSGRVLNYAIVLSTGHPDLDAAIDQVMRGASLPPFPADMAASEIEVSVAVRFALAR